MTLTPAQRGILRQMAAGDVPIFLLSDWEWLSRPKGINDIDIHALVREGMADVVHEDYTSTLVLTDAGREAAKGE